MYYDRYRLATGKAELHDVRKLAVGIVHGHMVGHDEALQSVPYTVKLDESTGAALSL